MKERIASLDIAKGVTIGIVVLFHLPRVDCLTCFNIWGGVIQTVYMPLFFAISGILHRNQAISKILRRLLIPYMTFYIMAVCVAFGMDMIKGYDFDWHTFYRPFAGDTSGYENTAIWFLLALTQIKIITQYTVKISHASHALLISITISIAGYVLGKHFGSYPYYISVALLCQLFYYAGFRFREYFVSRMSLQEFLFLVVILVALFMLNPACCNVSMNHIPMEYCSFMVISVVAIRLGIGVCDRLANCKAMSGINAILRYYGTNSLIVFGTHLMLIGITPVIGKMVNVPDVYIPVSMIVIMILEIPIIFFFNKYGKFLLGK